MRLLVTGGSRFDPVVGRDLYRMGFDLLQAYGLTECCGGATVTRPGDRWDGSVGQPLPGVEIKVLPPESEAGGERSDGEVAIRGPIVMPGYYNRPETTAIVLRDGWLHTGDLGVIDQDGYAYIVDRKKDVIIRGGQNIYPADIEEVLYQHPAVREAAVIGVEHASHGEEVKAVVALGEGHSATSEDLIAFCKERLAAYKYPRVVEFVDQLPKGATGKILKRELKK
jgi:long-chain acyl-CoA synthetase